jgi:hypothetical protein
VVICVLGVIFASTMTWVRICVQVGDQLVTIAQNPLANSSAAIRVIRMAFETETKDRTVAEV